MILSITLIAAFVLAIIATCVFCLVDRDWDIAPIVFVVALIICMLVCSLLAGIISTVFNKSSTDVNTIAAEVTHLDVTEAKGKYGPSTTTYRVSVVGEQFATVFEVKPEIYAGLKVGDKITVEVKTTNNTLLDDTVEYEIVNAN